MEVPGRQDSRDKIAIQNLGFASLEKPILKDGSEMSARSRQAGGLRETGA
jgi:hypothetical protein